MHLSAHGSRPAKMQPLSTIFIPSYTSSQSCARKMSEFVPLPRAIYICDGVNGTALATQFQWMGDKTATWMHFDKLSFTGVSLTDISQPLSKKSTPIPQEEMASRCNLFNHI